MHVQKQADGLISNQPRWHPPTDKEVAETQRKALSMGMKLVDPNEPYRPWHEEIKHRDPHGRCAARPDCTDAAVFG